MAEAVPPPPAAHLPELPPLYFDMTVKNHAAEPVTADGSIISSKTESGHGYGISNVRQCVEEIKGSFNISFENGVFTAEVIFPNVI